MNYIRRAGERGRTSVGWLDSYHSFSFGGYHDPAHMGVSTLRVINDDTVAPGAGFGTHGHRDMEIVSYVLEGAVRHEDSMGHRYTVPAGEIQLLSAGSGVMHSEYNDSETDPVSFLQIWITPNVRGTDPDYQQKRIEQDGMLTPLVTPDGRDGSLTIRQDASLYRVRLGVGQRVMLEAGRSIGYLHVIQGEARVGPVVLHQGDGAGFPVGQDIDLQAGEPLSALYFQLPA